MSATVTVKIEEHGKKLVNKIFAYVYDEVYTATRATGDLFSEVKTVLEAGFASVNSDKASLYEITNWRAVKASIENAKAAEAFEVDAGGKYAMPLYYLVRYAPKELKTIKLLLVNGASCENAFSPRDRMISLAALESQEPKLMRVIYYGEIYCLRNRPFTECQEVFDGTAAEYILGSPPVAAQDADAEFPKLVKVIDAALRVIRIRMKGTSIVDLSKIDSLTKDLINLRNILISANASAWKALDQAKRDKKKEEMIRDKTKDVLNILKTQLNVLIKVLNLDEKWTEKDVSQFRTTLASKQILYDKFLNRQIAVHNLMNMAESSETDDKFLSKGVQTYQSVKDVIKYFGFAEDTNTKM